MNGIVQQNFLLCSIYFVQRNVTKTKQTTIQFGWMLALEMLNCKFVKHDNDCRKTFKNEDTDVKKKRE